MYNRILKTPVRVIQAMAVDDRCVCSSWISNTRKEIHDEHRHNRPVDVFTLFITVKRRCMTFETF
jgi:hypothetical protein